ncbi:bifunctional 3-(3-hydroxy-phenyl)propionate/3-hydroxycinnamic acid hydroxylase [Mycobacterium asiaticum]|uniref:3-(3-hydroxyphenyl)propionate hydroxylase n=1 Tax=Mycobacterium asiaticum TaxID=1790 RepID=A0A1A3CQJ1_MYCAS|nr:bifunctional 3-(3-hydroxy-phenyl)propionate/3-hydroxycinnamic acid hydroxylase [Mycobacterium asiaticum]OBI89139.1 3-(3-hydroxyphenyl)propionate hydroxylase [Mycobacterium asiaticum]
MTQQVPVVIVGAGPTGIVAATLLAQYGVESLVLERWPGVYPQPRAVHLDDEIYRILARLGIAEQFAAISRPTLGLRLLDWQFNVLAEFHRDAARSDHGYPQANMFDQPELECLLRRNLGRYSGVELRGNCDVTAVRAEGDRTRVTFTDRSDGSVHRVDAEYVLGCDGANSVVRAQIGSHMQDLKFEQRWLVVDVATDADLGQWDGVYQVCGRVRAGTYMRIGENRYRWEFRLFDGESARDFDTVTTLRPLIAPWTTDVPDSELTLLRVTEYTFRAQIADRWRRGNIFLLGDAAHLTPPFIGQGMGAGVRDAMNLAWKIAAVRRGTLIADALNSYERERKCHARALIRLALVIGWSMTGGGRVGDRARRVMLPRLRFIPGLREKVVDSTTPALRRSALVHKSLCGGPLCGALCPNAVVAGHRRFDDVAGGGFALVTRAQPAADQEELLRSHDVTIVRTRPGDELDEWLRRGRAQAALVRPDRTVLRAARDVSGLCRWYSHRFPLGREARQGAGAALPASGKCR